MLPTDIVRGSGMCHGRSRGSRLFRWVFGWVGWLHSPYRSGRSGQSTCRPLWERTSRHPPTCWHRIESGSCIVPCPLPRARQTRPYSQAVLLRDPMTAGSLIPLSATIQSGHHLHPLPVHPRHHAQNKHIPSDADPMPRGLSVMYTGPVPTRWFLLPVGAGLPSVRSSCGSNGRRPWKSTDGTGDDEASCGRREITARRSPELPVLEALRRRAELVPSLLAW